MGNGGFFAGGVAQGFQAQQQIGQRGRALDIQKDQLAEQKRQALLQEAGKRIDATMGVVGKVIEGGKAGGLNLDEMGVYGNSIAGIETGGQAAPYQTIHPPTDSGARALGRYGVMDFNVGPWTKEVIGRAMTEEEFLASPEAQDAVFKAKFGAAIQQSGGSVADAASIWFTGQPLAEGADRSDGNLTGQQYVEKFLKNVATAPQRGLMATVDPLLQSVEGLAEAAGIDPAIYRKQTEALIAATPTSAEKAIAAGQAAGNQKLAEAQTLYDAGIRRVDALVTAGIKQTGDTGALEPDKRIELEQKLRKEYTAVSGDFITVRDAYGRVQTAFQNPSTESGVTDVALIFNYMKMLDPNSVVRESEYATVGNAQGVPARVRNLYNNLLSGAQLDQKARDDIFSLAGSLYEKQQRQQQRVTDQFTSIATKAGLDPNVVILDIEPADTQTYPEGTVIENDAGERLIRRGGAWVPG